MTVGVHSPKFEHEADPDALAAAVDRYDVRHPVLDDPELGTWQAYTARAWPTLVVVDPEGYVVAHLSGEGHVQGLVSLVEELAAAHEAKGTLHRGDGPYVPRPPQEGVLSFPGKITALPPELAAPDAQGPTWTPAGTASSSWTTPWRRCCAPGVGRRRATPTAARRTPASTSRRAWPCCRRPSARPPGTTCSWRIP